MSFSSGRNISNNVNTDEAQTLTNKTIDSANNSLVVDADTATVSNIEADNLKAGVIDDDLSTTSVNDDTVPSAKAAKAYTDAAAATAASDLSTHEADTSTHGVAGDIVGTTDTQTLTNKTIQGASVETPSRLDAKKDTLANLETYATTATDGELTYATDDEKFYGVVNNELVSLGGGLGSAQTIFTIEADSVNVAADVDGNDATFGGNDASALTGTLSQSTTALELLTGVKKVNKYEAAVSSQFDYFGYTRAIPQGWAGRTVAVEFTYRNNANTSNDDYTFNVKDETNNSVLLTRSLEAKVSADGNGETLRYLVNIPSDCLSVTIGFQNVGTSTDTALFFDKISMDIDDFNYKDVGYTTEWVDSGPIVVEATTTNPTKPSVVDLDIVKWRRVGDSMELTMTYYSESQAGAATGSGDYLFKIPSGYEMDASKVNFDISVDGLSGYVVLGTKVGTAHFSDSNNSFEGIVYPYDTTSLKISGAYVSPAGQGRGTVSSGMYALTSADSFNIKATIPIKGWQATSKHVVVDSGGADSHRILYNGYISRSSNQVRFKTEAVNEVTSVGQDYLEVDNTTFTKITALKECKVSVDIGLKLAGGQVDAQWRIYDSSNAIKESYDLRSVGTSEMGVSGTTAFLDEGDYIVVLSFNGLTDSASQVYLNVMAEAKQQGEYHLVPVNDQENVFSAWISNNGTASIRSQSSPFIESVTRTAQGVVQVNFKSGIFTQLPSVVGSVLTGGGSTITEQIQGLNTTGFQVVTKQIGNVFDSDFLVTVQKQGADYKEPKAFIGDVPLNYTQTKVLSSNVTTNTVVSDLTFNNLVIGKMYQIEFNAYFSTSGDLGVAVNIENGATLIRYANYNSDGPANEQKNATYITKPFKATSSTVTFTTDSASANEILRGNGTLSETHATITELNHTRETTRF